MAEVQPGSPQAPWDQTLCLVGAPGGILTFKTWKASHKNVNSWVCLKNLGDLASVPVPWLRMDVDPAGP